MTLNMHVFLPLLIAVTSIFFGNTLSTNTLSTVYASIEGNDEGEELIPMTPINPPSSDATKATEVDSNPNVEDAIDAVDSLLKYTKYIAGLIGTDDADTVQIKDLLLKFHEDVNKATELAEDPDQGGESSISAKKPVEGWKRGYSDNKEGKNFWEFVNEKIIDLQANLQQLELEK